MPWYDLDCENCGFLEDEPRAVEEREICPQCGGPASVAVTGVNFGGIIFSNAEHSSQLGVTFESNAQKRKYMKEHPKLIEFGKGDDRDKRMSYRCKSRAEITANRLGFSSNHDRMEHLKTLKPKKKATIPKSSP